MKTIIKLTSTLIVLSAIMLFSVSCGFLAFTTGTIGAAATPVEEKDGSNEYVMSAGEIPEFIISNTDKTAKAKMKADTFESVEKLGTTFLVLKDKQPTRINTGMSHLGIYATDPSGFSDNYKGGCPANQFYIVYKCISKATLVNGKKTTYVAYGFNNIKKDALNDSFDYNVTHEFLKDYTFNGLEVLMDKLIKDNELFYDTECDVEGYERSFTPRGEIKYLHHDEVSAVVKAADFDPKVRQFLRDRAIRDYKISYAKYKNVEIVIEKDYLLLPRTANTEVTESPAIYLMIVKVTGENTAGKALEKYIASGYSIVNSKETSVILTYDLKIDELITSEDSFDAAYTKNVLSKNSTHEAIELEKLPG